MISGEFSAGWLRDRGDDRGELLNELRDDGYEVLAVRHLRTRAWRAADTARLRLLSREQVAQDLLLRPPATAERAATDAS